MNTPRMAPPWQRIVCGLLCAAGVVACVAHGSTASTHHSHPDAITFLIGYGAFLFGYIALFGRLPGHSTVTDNKTQKEKRT